MSRKTFGQAFMEGLAIAMRRNRSLTIMGPGQFFEHTSQNGMQKPLFAEFGHRIFQPPSSESAMAAFAIGAAMTGQRMMLNFTAASFTLEAFNQIVNEAAVARYMSGGQTSVPVTFHAYHGNNFAGAAAQAASSPQAMLCNCPGIEIVLPSTPADVKGLIVTALQSPNPNFVFNHAQILDVAGEVPDGDYAIAFGQAEVKREGRDVTVVATSLAVHLALQAAAVLAREGIELEIVDPRTVVPLDTATIFRSVRKTGRLVTVDETVQMCSIGSEIAALVAEHAFDALKAPVARVAQSDAPMPFSEALEHAVLPNVAKIVAAVRRVMRATRTAAV